MARVIGAAFLIWLGADFVWTGLRKETWGDVVLGGMVMGSAIYAWWRSRVPSFGK